jgi:hypothetical protein
VSRRGDRIKPAGSRYCYQSSGHGQQGEANDRGLISFSLPFAAAKFGLAGSYTFYGVSAVISYSLVQELVRETRGKELEQMEG